APTSRYGTPQDFMYLVTVQVVDEVHEVLRGAVAGGGRKVPRGLVTPGAVERMLHDGQELDVGKAGAKDVLGQERGQLAVGQRAVALLGHPPPGAEVDLVDGDGRAQGVVA